LALVTISLNGQDVEVESGITILEAARTNGVEIPTLCNDEQLEPFTSCWLCAVKLEGMRRYVPSCGTRVSPGMKIWTDTEDVRAVRRMALELLLSNHRGDCVAPCKAACPAGVDVQGYIALIAEGQYREATKLVKEVNPFPLSIGRVCTRPCETDCRRNAVDEPVAIDYLKRFAADWDIQHENPYSPAVPPATGKKVAAVGAGPASLTLAYYLRQKGHDVTIFEALPGPGGMLRYGIPEYRLPKETLDAEVGLITGLGAEIKYERAMGRDFTLADLFGDGYEAVFLGLGAMGSRLMKVEGESLTGVWSGTEFLKKMGLGEKVTIGRHVAIIGGGNTAIDAARTSLRLGAEKVTVVYRRSRTEMPAWDVEVEAALHEGVEMHFLAAPTKIEGDGRCERLEYIEMELGEPDDSGRRRPVPVEGSEKTIEVDNVIAAIGQVPDLAAISDTVESDGSSLEARLELTRWGTIVAEEATGATAVPRVFAGGDVVTGAATAIEAIAAGGRAAQAIDRLLRGEEVGVTEPFFNIQKERWDSFPADELEDVVKAPRQEMPELPVAERIRTMDEVELGFTEEQALVETERCLECGCASAFTCRLRQYSAEYDASAGVFGGEVVDDPPDTRHPFIRLEPEKCILCGRCVRICEEVQGAEALGFFKRGFHAQMKPGLDKPLAATTCESCGQCVSTCPTAALSPVIDLPKPGPWAGRATTSTCTFCGTGCSVTLHTVGGILDRVTPSPTSIDGHTNLCVRGRFGFGPWAADDRFLAPAVRTDGVLEETSWERAVESVAERMKSAVDEYGPEGVAIFVSPRVTNEVAHRLVRLGREGLGTANVGSYGLVHEAGVFAALERTFGYPASTASYEDVRSADVILLLDSDIAEEQTVLGISVRKAVRNGAHLVVVSPTETRMSKMARVWIQAEHGQLSNVLLTMAGRALERGADRKTPPFAVRGLEELSKLAGASSVNVTVSGGTLEDVTDALVAAEKAVLIANLGSFDAASAGRDAGLAVALSVITGSSAAAPLVLFARTRANGQGLTDLGIGRESARLARELAAGSIRAALIVGEDPVSGAEDPDRVRESLAGLDFLMVADTVPTETTALADCILPLPAPGESQGSFTSSERRVQTVAGPLTPPAGLTDLELVSMLAVALGAELGSTDPSAVRGEFAAALGLPDYPAGNLPPGGLRWGGEALYEGGLRTPDGAADLSIPSVDAPYMIIDPRWTDSIEVRFSRLVEEAGLPAHVVRRHRVSA
jgi:formate dehydrogenase major subunit